MIRKCINCGEEFESEETELTESLDKCHKCNLEDTKTFGKPQDK